MTFNTINHIAGKSVVLATCVGIAGGVLARVLTPFGPVTGFIGGAVIGGTCQPFQYASDYFDLDNNPLVKTIGFIALQIFNILLSNQLCHIFNVSITFGATLILNAGILAVGGIVYGIYLYSIGN